MTTRLLPQYLESQKDLYPTVSHYLIKYLITERVLHQK